VLRARTVDTLDQHSTHPPWTRSALNYPRSVVANGVSLPSTKAGSSERALAGSVVTMIFFVEVDTYYDGAKDTQGARCRRLLRLRWWPLLELPAAPSGGPSSTSSSTMMVAAAGAPGSTRRGPVVDVFVDYDGGCCRSSRQHPQGARRQRLHRLRCWLLSELPAAPLGGPPSNVFIDYNGGCCRSS
jgi:hypothetical protein